MPAHRSERPIAKMTLLLVLDTGRSEAAFNMAFDELMLTAVRQSDTPILRFYGWMEPAATFGYFQAYSVVESLTPLRPLIRRPTGGGIVPHNADWTYSLAFPASHPWYEVNAVESYRRVHEWLRLAFAKLGAQTELAASKLVTGPGQCFAGYELNDLLWHGRKIAGAAQRRTREGLLIQGSAQPPRVSLHREDWCAAMQEVAVETFQFQPGELDDPPLLRERATRLASAKYATEAYNRKK